MTILAETPNIDRLAKEGTDFYRFTVAVEYAHRAGRRL